MPFLPVSREELNERGIGRPDFICVTGDAYVDHPSFGIAIISRVIESPGFSVAMLAQPVADEDFRSLGAPKYAFMVTGGNIDSMVSNYTVAGKSVMTTRTVPAARAEGVPTARLRYTAGR